MRSEVAILLGILGAGAGVLFPLARSLAPGRGRRRVGWALLVTLQGAALALSWPLGFWGRVLATWTATFIGFKGLVLLNASPERLSGLTLGRYACWGVAWLGMDLDAWTRPRGPAWTPGAWRTLGEGAGLVVAGGALVAAFWLAPFPPRWWLLQGWGVVGGLIIATFLGAARVLTGAWQALGREVPPLFARPFNARSLGDWWGRRWNLSVHTVLLVTVWTPLRKRLGPARATDAVFLASGLLHELVVSYPSRGGYGGPFLYFVLQALGLRLERTRRVRTWLRGSPTAGVVWTLGVVLLPAWMLFHPPLVRAAVYPWLR